MCHFWGEICLISCHILGTLTERGTIHWVGVQTWLQSSQAGSRCLPPIGSSFDVPLLGGNLPHFAPHFGNTDRDGYYRRGDYFLVIVIVLYS